jgi:hypothetical protein
MDLHGLFARLFTRLRKEKKAEEVEAAMLSRHAMRDRAGLISRFSSLIRFLAYLRIADKALNLTFPITPLTQD